MPPLTTCQPGAQDALKADPAALRAAASRRAAAWSTVADRAIGALRAADATVIEAALFWRANQLHGLGGAQLRAACDARSAAELRALRAGPHLLWARLRLRKSMAREERAS